MHMPIGIQPKRVYIGTFSPDKKATLKERPREMLGIPTYDINMMRSRALIDGYLPLSTWQRPRDRTRHESSSKT